MKVKIADVKFNAPVTFVGEALEGALRALNRAHTGTSEIESDAVVSEDLKDAHYNIRIPRTIDLMVELFSDGTFSLKKDTKE